jgi:DNA-binding transcriptional ArsR family regulator
MASKFLTNYALVLFEVGRHPNATLRQIASAVDISDRAALSNLRALEGDGLISRRKQGRRVHYQVDVRALLDCQTLESYTVQQLIDLLWRLGDQPEDESP